MSMDVWRKAWALVGKDLALEWRTRESFLVMLLFGAIVGAVLGIAFELRVDGAGDVAPGALWVALAFSGVLGLGRSMAREQEDGCLEGLMLAPVDGSCVYLAKAAANALSMLGVGLVLLPLFSVLFGVNLLRPGLLVVLLLGAAGLSGVGTLLSTMVPHTRAREALLPVLLLPAVVPLVIGAVRATAGVASGQSLSAVAAWLRLMAAFDLVLGAAACLLYACVTEG